MSDDLFKSSVPWPTIQPTPLRRTGQPAGKAKENRLLEKAGGPEGIRRIDVTDLYGTTHTLNTRGGNPIVRSKSTRELGAAIIAVRGFVAHVPSASVAARFSPYSLALSDPAYKIFRNTYTVLPFATTYNVPSGDVTKWNDVASFYAAKILINGKEMPLLKTTGIPAGDYLPWLIPASGTGLSKYGDADKNIYEKRVFAVGRDSVRSWSSTPSVALNGSTYRPYKSIVCGAKIEQTTHTAKLSQLVYTGPSWDSIIGGWGMNTAQVAMLLTAPYLSKIDGTVTIDQASTVLVSQPPTAGVTTGSATFPETELGVVGVGELAGYDFSEGAYNMFQNVVFPWRYTFSGTLNGESSRDTTYINWAGSASSTSDILGLTFSVNGSNTVAKGSHHETYTYLETDILLFGSGGGGNVSVEGGICTSSGGVVWTDLGDGDLTPRGACAGSDPGYYHHAAGSIEDAADFTSSDQNGSFSISGPRGALVAIEFSRYKEAGNQVNITGIEGRYAPVFEDPYGWINSIIGFGVGGKLEVSLYAPAPLTVIGQRQGPIEAHAAAHVGGLFYSSYDLDDIAQIYESDVGPRTAVDTSSLTWTTSDYILYDDTDNVFVSIEGSFSGSQSDGEAGEATLTVSIKIDTPLGVQTQPLSTYALTYTELLPEEFITYGLTAVPSPNQRLMFTPMFREQGGFKGAHYTTEAEATAGAVRAYLVNFVLKLDMYSAIGEDNSNSTLIHFIPCNLLEMLYSYVFSSSYGIDSYHKYPVTRVDWFNLIASTLFGPQWRVHYRDGAMIDWLDALGGTYITETATELTRT